MEPVELLNSSDQTGVPDGMFGLKLWLVMELKSSREGRAPSLGYGAFQDAVLTRNQFGFSSLT
jgi:hypothetical protein